MHDIIGLSQVERNFADQQFTDSGLKVGSSIHKGQEKGRDDPKV